MNRESESEVGEVGYEHLEDAGELNEDQLEDEELIRLARERESEEEELEEIEALNRVLDEEEIEVETQSQVQGEVGKGNLKKSRKPWRKSQFQSKGIKGKVLEGYSRTGALVETMAKLKIQPKQHYRWLERDSIYAEDWELALEITTELLEGGMFKRAHEGVEEDTGWYKGVPGGKVTRYSDSLAIALMKARRPDRFRETYQVNVDTTVTLDVEGAQKQLQSMMKRNPALLSMLSGAVGKTSDEEGVGTPKRLLDVVDVPPQASRHLEKQNNPNPPKKPRPPHPLKGTKSTPEQIAKRVAGQKAYYARKKAEAAEVVEWDLDESKRSRR